jgi:hypothetical protein
MSNTLNEIESGLNLAGAAGAALGGPIGSAVNAALPVMEGVVNAVAEEPPHQTALTDITNAVNAAAPVVTAAGAALSPTTAAQVTSGMAALQAMLGFLKAIL